MALCSLSTGSRVAPDRAISAKNSAPAATSVSLLASAIVAPWRTAARVGRNPAAPTIADITTSAGRDAASSRAAGPAAASMPDPSSASRSAGSRAGSAVTAISAPSRRAAAARPEMLVLPVTATVRICSGPKASITEMVEAPIDPVTPRMEIRRAIAHQTKTG